MKTKLIIFICLMVLNFCSGQTRKYREKLFPKVKAKLDSLYPQATSELNFNNPYLSDTTQVVSMNCHCDETEGAIILVFDSNANILYKEVHFHSQKNLPDTIVRYIQKYTNDSIKFATDYMEKYYNNKGEISYGIMEDYSPNNWTYQGYLLKFKPNGELISKKALPHYGR